MPHVPHCHNTYPLIKYLSGLRYLFTFPLFALLIQVSLCQIQCYQRLDAAVSFFLARVIHLLAVRGHMDIFFCFIVCFQFSLSDSLFLRIIHHHTLVHKYVSDPGCSVLR